jgi:NitT/TauT family transport system permease protein
MRSNTAQDENPEMEASPTPDQRARALDGADPRARSKGKDRLFVLLTGIGLIALWQAYVTISGVQSFLVPSPLSVAKALYYGFATGTYLPHTWVTVQELVGGFVLGSVVAVALALMISRFEILNRLLMPYVVAFQAVPKVALAPLFVTWFGLGITSKIVMAAVISFFPVLLNMLVGLNSVDRDQMELFSSLRASQSQIYRKLRIPASLPFVFAGLDMALVFAVVGAIIGEFVGAQAGLGYLIMQSNFRLDVANTFAILIVLAVIGYLLHVALLQVAKRTMTWTSFQELDVDVAARSL